MAVPQTSKNPETKPPKKKPTVGDVIKARLFHGTPPAKGTPEWVTLCENIQAVAAEHGAVSCLGKTRSGWPCTNTFLGAGRRCKMHGGGSLKAGPSHPSWEHGRSSIIAAKLPERFRESFAAFVDDPNLLSLRPEIAVMDGRFYELLDKLDTGESAQAWEEAGRTTDELLALLQDQDPDLDQAMKLANELRRRVFTAKRYGSLWGELGSMAKGRKELVEVESKRLKEAGAVMNAVDVLAIVHRLLDIFFRHVLDKKVLQAVLTDVDRSGILPEVPKLPATSSAKS